MIKSIAFFFLALITPAAILSASEGPAIDKTYGTAGQARLDFDAGGDNNDFPAAAVALPNGSLIVGGYSDYQTGGSFDGDYHQVTLAKFQSDGSPDPTFGPAHNGRVTLSIVPIGGDGQLNSVALTSDGHILALGTYSLSSSQFIFIVRLNSDGSLDTSFNSTGYRIFGGSYFVPSTVGIGAARVTSAANGEVICLMTAATSSAIYAVVVKLQESGAFDTGFGGGNGYVTYTSDAVTTPAIYAGDIAILPDAKIVLAGGANHGNDASNVDYIVMRLNADGTIDNTFGSSGKTYVAFDEGGALTDFATALTVDRAGEYVLAGDVSGLSQPEWGVVRITNTGALDTSFGSGGRVFLNASITSNGAQASAVFERTDGRIIVGGSMTGDTQYGTTKINFGGNVPVAVLLTSAGDLDPNFGNAGVYSPISASAPTSFAIVDPAPPVLFGDYIYFAGAGFKPSDTDTEYGVLRAVISIFRNDFDSDGF